MNNTEHAILVSGTRPPHQGATRLSIVTEDGTNLTDLLDTEGSTPTGEDILLTDYVVGDPGEVGPEDTLNEAIAKLEARIAVLENDG